MALTAHEVAVAVGPSKDFFYGLFWDTAVRHPTPHPFMRPAFDAGAGGPGRDRPGPVGGDRAGGRDERAAPVTADTAICMHLLTLAPVTALVDTRITTGKWHQSPGLPAVRVAFIDETTEMQLRGTVQSFRARIQVDAMATEKLSGVDAKGVAHAVMAAIYGDGATTGLAGFAGTAGDLAVASIVPLERREQYIADELRQWIVTQDFFVRHRG